MAARTKGGVLLPLIVVAVVAVVAVPQLRNQALDVYHRLTGGTELVGDGDSQFMVAASASSNVRKCLLQQELPDSACDDLKFVSFDAAKMPFITRNIGRRYRIGGQPA